MSNFQSVSKVVAQNMATIVIYIFLIFCMYTYIEGPQFQQSIQHLYFASYVYDGNP